VGACERYQQSLESQNVIGLFVRRVEDVSTTVHLDDDYDKVKVDVKGRLVRRPDCGEGEGGRLSVKVDVDSK
jgi:hypothetical protein